MTQISLNNVTKVFGNIVALNNISLEIKDKEFFVILGPSGAGKTTFLNVISGIEKPEKGEIYFGKNLVNNIMPSKRNVSMTFENYALYPHYTVFKNLASPLNSRLIKRKLNSKLAKDRINNVAKMLKIDAYLDRLPSELSGGQKQRVALGRALIKEPEVLLLDEPIAHLDAKIKDELRTEFHILRDSLSTSVIYTTHDYKEAISLGDRIMVLDRGKIQQIDTPRNIYNFPKNIMVASIIGWPTINIIESLIDFENKKLLSIIYNLNYSFPNKILNNLKNKKKEKLIIGIRPSDIKYSKQKSEKYATKAVINVVEVYNNYSVINSKIGEVNITILAMGIDLHLKHNDEIWLYFDEQYIYLFDKDTGENINLLEQEG